MAIRPPRAPQTPALTEPEPLPTAPVTKSEVLVVRGEASAARIGKLRGISFIRSREWPHVILVSQADPPSAEERCIAAARACRAELNGLTSASARHIEPAHSRV